MDDILRALEEKYNSRLKVHNEEKKEIEELKQSIDSYKRSIGMIGSSPLQEHNVALSSRPGFPKKESLLHKIKYIDEPLKIIWTRPEMMDMIIKIEGEGSAPFAGVVDGGDIQSVKFTSKKLNCVTPIKDNTCICHRLNNNI